MKFLTKIFVASVIILSSLNSIAQNINSLNWIKAPATVNITDKAQMKLSGNLMYLDESETNKFLKLTGNLPSPGSFTIYNGENNWFSIFHFKNEGYVKDDEKIDADALLKVLKEGNEAGLAERKKQGLDPLYLDGWYIEPRYDSDNKRLEWATKLHDKDNQTLVNFTTRILGRSGYMSATLVSDPQSLDNDIKAFKYALQDFDYINGERYSEFRNGDKIAAYGLGALVLGGAAAAVASKGGFKFLWALVLAAFAAVGAFFKKIFGRKE
jgi:uncharacterized membrane-anchored protein